MDRILSWGVTAQDSEALGGFYRDFATCVFLPLFELSLTNKTGALLLNCLRVIDLRSFIFPAAFSVFLPLENYSLPRTLGSDEAASYKNILCLIAASRGERDFWQVMFWNQSMPSQFLQPEKGDRK